MKKLILPLIVVLLTEFAYGVEWSAPASHHANVVRVQCGNSAGSGVYCKFGQLEGVLTAKHVTDRVEASATFPDGMRLKGGVIVDRTDNDLSFIFLKHPTLEPLKVGRQVTSKIEILGYGGPERRLRHFLARPISNFGNLLWSDGDVTSGDSGGPWLSGTSVIGITSGGSDTQGSYSTFDGQAWPRHTTSCSATPGAINSFLARVETQYYGNPSTPFQQNDLYPPQQPPICQNCQCNIDEIVAKVIAKLKEDPSILPQGPEGPQGPAGLAGLTGPPGPQGPPGPPPDLSTLPPLTMELYSLDGDKIDSSTKYLGETFKLRLTPVTRGRINGR